MRFDSINAAVCDFKHEALAIMDNLARHFGAAVIVPGRMGSFRICSGSNLTACRKHLERHGHRVTDITNWKVTK